jgi:hypothetical protein
MQLSAKAVKDKLQLPTSITMDPPEGFEDYGHGSWSQNKPRPRPPHPLHVDTSSRSNKFMDDDMMMMPPNTYNPKYPSPNSVIDDLSSFSVVRKQQPQPPSSQAYSSSHRRNHSFHLEDTTTTQYGGHASYLTPQFGDAYIASVKSTF